MLVLNLFYRFMTVSENIAMKARAHGIHIKSYQSFYEEGPKSDVKKSIDAIASTGVRIVFIAAEGPAQLAAMTVAAHNGYINNNTVWIAIDTDANALISAVDSFNTVLARRANNTDIIPQNYDSEYVDVLVKPSKDSKSASRQSMLDSINPVEYAARLTNELTPIKYEEVFSGGVFMIDTLRELSGYKPFDTFLDKWSRLDPSM